MTDWARGLGSGFDFQIINTISMIDCLASPSTLPRQCTFTSFPFFEQVIYQCHWNFILGGSDSMLSSLCLVSSRHWSRKYHLFVHSDPQNCRRQWSNHGPVWGSRRWFLCRLGWFSCPTSAICDSNSFSQIQNGAPVRCCFGLSWSCQYL